MRVWPQLRRVPRCALCGRRLSRAANWERVDGKLVALCRSHAGRSTDPRPRKEKRS